MPKTLVTVDASVLEDLRAHGAALLSSEDQKTLVLVIDSLLAVTRALQDARTTMARLRRMFGLRKSEKTSVIVGATGSPSPDAGATAVSGATDDTGEAAPDREPTTPPGDGAACPPPAANADAGGPTTEKPKRKPANGHGRTPASAYTEATHIRVPHESLHCGDACPHCAHGTLYALPDPGKLLRIVGQAPLAAFCYDVERLRCSGCGDVLTAKAPPEAQGEKYTEGAAATIANLRYGSGLPFNRLESLQADQGTPVPASTQWQVVKGNVGAVRPAWDAILDCAAQAPLFHTDDTCMPILAFMGKRRAKALLTGRLDAPDRTGLFTTGIVAGTIDGPIAIFLTGRWHAGENFEWLLERRAEGLPPPLHMSDALSRNAPGENDVLVAYCLAHARRNFVEQFENFPAECRDVLRKIGEVYGIDDLCRTHGLTPEQRLSVHQRESAPILAELYTMMVGAIDDKLVEPNSGLGQAYSYMTKRWKSFTVFLRVAGAPIDNTICERALKKAILHRKNSMFYMTQTGADVGDIYMTLIFTARLHGKDPVRYLTALMRHADAVRAAPRDWLPWRYEATLALMAKAPALATAA